MQHTEQRTLYTPVTQGTNVELRMLESIAVPEQQGSEDEDGAGPDEDFKDAKAQGNLQNLPYFALLAILLIVACGVAAVVVLTISDGKKVEDWQVRPAVWLAIFAAIGNTCLSYALSEGVTIAWWRLTLKPGPLRALQHVWEQGTGIWAALTSIRHMNLVALATIVTTVALIEGPLLQRASSTKLSQEHETTSVNMTVASQLPFGYTGVEYAGDSGSKTNRPIVTPWFLNTLLNYNRRTSIQANTASNCTGICTGKIKAAGLYRECNETSDIFTYSENSSVSRRIFGTDWKLVTQYPALYGLDYDDAEVTENLAQNLPVDEPYIQLNITYSPLPDLANVNTDGVINLTYASFRKTCRIYSAETDYHFTIQNDTVLTDDGILNTSVEPSNRIVLESAEPANLSSIQNLRRSVLNTTISPTWPWPTNSSLEVESNSNYSLYLETPVYFLTGNCDGQNCPAYTTLGGLTTAASDLFAGNVTGRYEASGNGVIYDISGSLVNQFMVVGDTFTNASVVNSDPLQTSTGWDDPTEFIFDSLDEIMFRLAIDTAYVDALQNVSWYYREYTEDGGSRRIEPPSRTAPGSEQYQARPQAQVLQMQRTRTIQVFESNYYYLAGALIVMYLGLIVVVPLFYGFWQLGRSVSLAPLETANAFGAPLLLSAGANVTARDIVDKLGNEIVVYGQAADGRLQLHMSTRTNRSK